MNLLIFRLLGLVGFYIAISKAYAFGYIRGHHDGLKEKFENIRRKAVGHDQKEGA